jgi:hypothetical protein
MICHTIKALQVNSDKYTEPTIECWTLYYIVIGTVNSVVAILARLHSLIYEADLDGNAIRRKLLSYLEKKTQEYAKPASMNEEYDRSKRSKRCA